MPTADRRRQVSGGTAAEPPSRRDLGGDVAPTGGGNDPLTASNVDRAGVFSAYAWIALDELSLSHDQRVIAALENASLSSPEAFYPSSPEGDGDQRARTIFQSCRGGPRSPRSPAGLAGESDSRSLLFYLKDHARFPARLAAHRALILAKLWGQTPDQLHLLHHAVSALRAVADGDEGHGLAAAAEVYQTRVRPVCRAMLFGFGEHELREEAVGPLLEDPAWVRDFIAAAKRVLSLMLECMPKAAPASESPDGLESDSEMWPPLRDCPVLNNLVRKLRGEVQPSSVELHHTIIFTFEMTRSIDSFQSVVPSFYNLFLTGTLFNEMPPVPKGSAQQRDLLNKAIVERAEKSSKPVIDSFAGIQDVELFGKALGLDSNYVRTRYLIEIIRLGKDTCIDDLLSASGPSLDKGLFAERVSRIVCARLDATIASLKRTKNYRGILSLLDADASHWVREEASAECSAQPTNNYATASLIATHSMVMRLQSTSESLDDASLSEKIDALCLMSGTLLKAVQAQEQEAVLRV